MTALQARHLVIDDFLPAADADRMLDQMLAGEALFIPSAIGRGPKRTVNPDFRSSLRLPKNAGVDLTGFVAAVHARADALRGAIGVTDFPIFHTECSIVAHRGGDFYKRHIDAGKAFHGQARMVSCVYYLHRRPRGFSGGELAIHPFFGPGEVTRTEPVHNRLAVFPSFVPHEVLPTAGAERFADSRFSINCWLHREIRLPEATEGPDRE